MQNALAVVWVVLVWWFSTGVLLYIVGLPRRTLGRRFCVATMLMLAALYGLSATSTNTDTFGAYAAFTCSIVVWGWLELSFLSGLITGPRKVPCVPEYAGWKRFCAATAAILYHELAIAALMLAVIVLTAGQPNQIGTGTFLILWAMRLSAKLNLFLGVRNHYLNFLPDHLRYLGSFFRTSAANWLFPFAVAAATGIAIWLVYAATAPDATAGEIAGYTLLACLMTLALLEHWLLVLPISASALWNWGLRGRGVVAAPGECARPTSAP